MAGLVTARLNAASGDWDLALADAKSNRSLSTSRAFNANEVTQAWVDAGQQLRITGCRLSGNASTAAVRIILVDAAKPDETSASIVRVPHLSQGMLQGLEQAGFDPPADANREAGETARARLELGAILPPIDKERPHQRRQQRQDDCSC